MKKLLNTLFVTIADAKVNLENENVCVKKDNEILLKVPLLNLEGLVMFNYFGASHQLMAECAKRNITISFLSEYGKFLGAFYGETKGNVLLRREQYRIADDSKRSLDFARNFIFGKLHNQKWVLERGLRDNALRLDAELLKTASEQITESMKKALACDVVDTLRAIEGSAAHYYFRAFDELILHNKDRFAFENRNRRPPTDPVNAMLSFAYTLLTSECRHALETAGLDSYVGFMHVDRPGRASMALDLIEELRPHFADRFVLSLINRGEITPGDFEVQESGAVLMTAKSRKGFLAAWQQRKKETITHPFLKEKLEWGIVPHVQAMLLARTIRGDLDEYPPFLWK
jgi:CRISPR-associated protein Cas1